MPPHNSLNKSPGGLFSGLSAYRKWYIRSSDPGILRFVLVVLCFSLAFPRKSKKCPDPGRNLDISYHTAELYDVDDDSHFQSSKCTAFDKEFDSQAKNEQFQRPKIRNNYLRTVCCVHSIIYCLIRFLFCFLIRSWGYARFCWKVPGKLVWAFWPVFGFRAVRWSENGQDGTSPMFK